MIGIQREDWRYMIAGKHEELERRTSRSALDKIISGSIDAMAGVAHFVPGVGTSVAIAIQAVQAILKKTGFYKLFVKRPKSYSVIGGQLKDLFDTSQWVVVGLNYGATFGLVSTDSSDPISAETINGFLETYKANAISTLDSEDKNERHLKSAIEALEVIDIDNQPPYRTQNIFAWGYRGSADISEIIRRQAELNRPTNTDGTPNTRPPNMTRGGIIGSGSGNIAPVAIAVMAGVFLFGKK